MTNSVIQDLENEDTTFTKRFGETTTHLGSVSDWVRTIEWKCHEARSTSQSNDWDRSHLKTDFFVTIETTKKAISDKRFEEMLSTPPIGWILMGIVKSRKDGTIKAQYIKEDDYPITPIEVINERYREMVSEISEKISSLSQTKEDQLKQTISTLSQQMAIHRLDQAMNNIKQWKKEINLLSSIQKIFPKLHDGDCTEDREYFGTHNYNWEISELFQNLMNTPTMSRFVWRDIGLFDMKSDLTLLVNWREGDTLPHSHTYGL